MGHRLMFCFRFLGGQNEKGAPILGGSAAEAVVLGRTFRAVSQVLGQVLAEHSTRLAPPSKDGVGGFKAPPHAADLNPKNHRRLGHVEFLNGLVGH